VTIPDQDIVKMPRRRDRDEFSHIHETVSTMTTHPPKLSFARLLTLLLPFFFAALGFAQTAGTGTITGRVFNPTTGEYVRNAEVRLAGTDRIESTGSDGSFEFLRVPAGQVTLTVNYTGYTPATDTFNVTAGQAVAREINLASGATRPGVTAGDQPLVLGQFVVASEREGNAKAIMEQRRSMNMTTSIASDVFGDVAEGNVGEFMKYLPGVQIDYVEGVARGPKLGGLDSQYTQLTVDGGNFASADALTAGGDKSRSASFEQMSINNIESIEISRTASADMDANAPGGRVNLKTKRAFDLKGRRINYQLSASANSEEFTLRRTYGPQHGRSHHVMPNYIFGYSDSFLDRRLGLTFNLSSSKQYSEQLRVTNAYNTTPTTADPRPKVLQAITFKDGPRVVQNFGSSLTADYKLLPNLVLSLTGMYNAYLNNADARQITLTTSTNNTTAATGRTTVLGDGLTDIRTSDVGTTANTGHTAGTPGSGAQKLTNTLTLLPSLEYKLGPLTVEAKGTYSHSKNDYEGLVRGISRGETLNTIVTNFSATRPSADSHEWTIRQLSGPDWSNLANYTNPRLTDEGRFALTEIWSGQLDATYRTPLRLPSFLKFGGKWKEETRTLQNFTGLYNWSYIGPGGNKITGTNATTGVPNIDGLGTFAGFQSPHAFDMGTTNALTIDKMLPLVDRNAIATALNTHPEQFVSIVTPADYYNSVVANDRHMQEAIDALYGMANTRVGPWEFQGGVRWERTVTESREVTARSAAETRAAGFPVDNTGRATTFAGMDYQYLSLPRSNRRGVYDYFFPSVSAKYNLGRNLTAQAGYSYTISRPPLTALSGAWTINETTQVISAPNPNLEPELSDNTMARLAYYFEPVGQLSLTVSQNEIKHARLSRTLTAAAAEAAGFSIDPAYASYQITAPFNVAGVTRFRSAEVAYSQALSFLPGPFRGLNINASYTRTTVNRRYPDTSPNTVTGSLGWGYDRYTLRFGAVWRDDTPTTTTVTRYFRHHTTCDLSGGVRINQRVSLFFQARRLFNDSDLIFEGVNSEHDRAVLQMYENYGTNWVFGVKGTF
jgi:TonB-dependent receptor